MVVLEDLREEVLRQAQAAEDMGLCRHRSGNFSLRDPAGDFICLTPSGFDRRKMTAADILVLDRAGQVLEAAPGRRPSSEALMHLAAYEARPEIRAVAHTHSRFAVVFAVLRQSIPAVVAEMTHLGCRGGRIPLAAYGRPGSAALASSVKEPLAESDVLLLASHGVLAVDEGSLAEALLKAAYVEEIAAIYYHARLLAEEELPLLPAEDLGQGQGRPAAGAGAGAAAEKGLV